MHRWYVKSITQTNHAARAALLGCAYVLESTSTQVNPNNPLPHVIVQTRLGVNHVFPEPTTLAVLNAILDEAETPEEATVKVKQLVRDAATARLKMLPDSSILNDLLLHLGIKP